MSLLQRLEMVRTPLYSCLAGMLVGSLLTAYWRRTPPPPPTVVTTGQVHTTELAQTQQARNTTQVVTVEHVVTRVVYRDPVTGHATKEVTREQGPSTATTTSKEEQHQVTREQTAEQTLTTSTPTQTTYSLGVAYLQDFRRPAAEWAPDWGKAVVTGAARLGTSPFWLEAGVAPVGHTVQLGVRYEW